MRRLLPVLLLLCIFALYGVICQDVWLSREQVRADMPAGYIIPSKFSRILALGNQGLLADFLFLKTATFVGGRSGSGMPLSEEDWRFVWCSLAVVTDLDPYFTDSYLLAEGLLAWDAGKPEEANRLFVKGMQYRTSDWRLPFFVGFNYFYFLKDYATASEYLIKASQITGSPAYLPTLAARLAYYGGKTKTALLFLKEMMADTDDPLLRNRLETRLLALEGATLIEDALEAFQAERGRFPDSLSELVSSGVLSRLPIEPYGGDWVFNKKGQVYSTSKFTENLPKNSQLPE